MDRENLTRIALRERTNNNLKSTLSIIDAIDRYEKVGFTLDGNSDAKNTFCDFVDTIVNELPDLNTYNEDWVEKVAGINDFEEQSLFLELAYYEAGKHLCDVNPKPSIEWLENLEDSTRFGFYFGYRVDVEYIESIINHIHQKIDNVVLKSDSCHIKGQELLDWCKLELSDKLSQEEIISKIDPYNDGAYTRLPEYINIIRHQLLQDGNIELWIKLIQSLRYFPLQGALIYAIRNSTLCLSVMKSLADKFDYAQTKVLQYLLRERLFSLLRDEQENLAANADSEYLGKNIRMIAVDELGNWESSLPLTCKEAVNVWQRVFGREELSGWFAKRESSSRYKSQKYAEQEQKILDILESNVSPIITDEQIEKADYSTLLYYAKIAATNSFPKDWCTKFANRFINVVFTEEGFFAPTLSTDAIQVMRNLYTCIDQSVVDVIEAIKRNIPAENSNTDESYQQLFKAQRAESYLLAILFLQTEETESREQFNRASQYLFGRLVEIESCTFDYYFLPLFIGELIVSQVMHDLRDGYETSLIQQIKPIRLLLRVLSADESISLSEGNKGLLKERISNEWEEDRKRASKFEKKQIEYLDCYINKIVSM